MQQKHRILVIDDNRSLVLAAERILQKAGYDVSTAFNGGEGIEKACAEKPDLIILDIVMPDMDGYEVCRRLKKYPEIEDVPVIFLSVKGEIDESKGSAAQGLKEVDLSYKCGASNFLTKPVSADDLLEAVRGELSFLSFMCEK